MTTFSKSVGGYTGALEEIANQNAISMLYFHGRRTNQLVNSSVAVVEKLSKVLIASIEIYCVDHDLLLHDHRGCNLGFYPTVIESIDEEISASLVVMTYGDFELAGPVHFIGKGNDLNSRDIDARRVDQMMGFYQDPGQFEFTPIGKPATISFNNGLTISRTSKFINLEKAFKPTVYN